MYAVVGFCPSSRSLPLLRINIITTIPTFLSSLLYTTVQVRTMFFFFLVILTVAKRLYRLGEKVPFWLGVYTRWTYWTHRTLPGVWVIYLLCVLNRTIIFFLLLFFSFHPEVSKTSPGEETFPAATGDLISRSRKQPWQWGTDLEKGIIDAYSFKGLTRTVMCDTEGPHLRDARQWFSKISYA